MKLIFIRHGEPDYSIDSLTEKGWKEAELLAKRATKWPVTQFYVSPLGRAKDTASCTLKAVNREAIILDWLREFSYPIDDPATGRHGVPWDFTPGTWTKEPQMFTMNDWVNTGFLTQNPKIASEYPNVCQKFDELLASYGYTRDDKFYRVKEERFISSTVGKDGTIRNNHLPDDKHPEPTLVFFCHLGVICIILSHLLNIPFPLLVHGFFLPTTSLTVLSTEERWSNEAYFRVQVMGDANHLLQNGEPISPAGSFSNPFQY